MNIGSKIQMLRLQNNMTQEDLAEKVGLSRGMIARIEIGSRLPNVIVADKIAEVLGVELKELVKMKID